MHELLGLPYSPWTEKARWALDARHVPYRYRHYQPILGEPELRVRLRKWTGTVSVPVLLPDDGAAIADSAAIARWADARGEGPALFPAGEDALVTRFVEVSERALSNGRALALARMLKDDAALTEMVPRRMRRARSIAAAIGRFGVARTLRKYGGAKEEDVAREAVARALEEVRDALGKRAEGSVRTIAKAFSFADIAVAQALVFVAPPAEGKKRGPVRIGAASRRNFEDPPLAARFADLVSWRDELYETYRGGAPRSVREAPSAHDA